MADLNRYYEEKGVKDGSSQSATDDAGDAEKSERKSVSKRAEKLEERMGLSPRGKNQRWKSSQKSSETRGPRLVDGPARYDGIGYEGEHYFNYIIQKDEHDTI
jgi:hypothetical protein